jgi:hypothetical protein
MKAGFAVASAVLTLVAHAPRARADYRVTLVGENRAVAASGAVIRMTGGGRFNAAVESARLEGTFAQIGSQGTLIKKGTWRSVAFVRFRRFGSGDQVGGVLEVTAKFVADNGTFEELPVRFTSLVGKPDTFGEDPGTTVGPFTDKESGQVKFEP